MLSNKKYVEVLDFVNGEIGQKLGLDIVYYCWDDCAVITVGKGVTPTDEEQEMIAYYSGLLDEVLEEFTEELEELE